MHISDILFMLLGSSEASSGYDHATNSSDAGQNHSLAWPVCGPLLWAWVPRITAGNGDERKKHSGGQDSWKIPPLQYANDFLALQSSFSKQIFLSHYCLFVRQWPEKWIFPTSKWNWLLLSSSCDKCPVTRTHIFSVTPTFRHRFRHSPR